MFALDTVLFRLPRADLPPTALVTMRVWSPPRVYWRGLLIAKRQYYPTRCVRMTSSLFGVVDPLPRLRTDSTWVGEIRPSLGACASAVRSS
jgi:hypothetical protein